MIYFLCLWASLVDIISFYISGNGHEFNQKFQRKNFRNNHLWMPLLKTDRPSKGKNTTRKIPPFLICHCIPWTVLNKITTTVLAVCHLKSQIHYSCPLTAARFPFPFSELQLLLFCSSFCLSHSGISRRWFYALSVFNLCQLMIWNREKSKLQIEDPLMLRKQCCQRMDLLPSRACQLSCLTGNRKNGAVPAGSPEHSFLFGFGVPDAHIIKLLNEDFVAHL